MRLLGSLRMLLAPSPPATASAGEIASGWGATGGIPDVDYLEDMAFPEYLDKFRRLTNHPQIAKVLRESTEPILNADWMVEPASDDRRDILIAEFVGANLYQQEGKAFGAEYWAETMWETRLQDILRNLVNGFSVFHRTYRQQGNYTVVHKLKYLMPMSILRFVPGDEPDSFTAIERQYVGTDGKQKNEIVSMDDLVWYTWDQEGSNFLGKPLLRSMWMAHEFYMRAVKLMMIDKQKTAVGIPWFKNPVGDSPDNVNRGKQVAQIMRSGRFENLFVRLNEGQDFGWKEGGTSTKGFPDILDLLNAEIAKVGANPATSLGIEGAGGSRGVAGTQASFSTLLLEGIAKKVARQERYRIRELIDMNFSPPPPVYPAIKFSGIDPFEKTRIAEGIVLAIGAKAITNTLETENELRRTFNLMEITEDERKTSQTIEPSLVTPGASSPGMAMPRGSDIAPSDIEGTPSPAAQQRSRIALQAVDDLIVRAKVDHAALSRELEKFESLYLATLQHVQADMREAVIQQIRRGQLAPLKPVQVKIPFQDELRDRLVAILKSVRDYGRDQVMNEVGRQLRTLGRTPAPNPATRRGAITYSNNRAEVTAEIDISALVDRLQTQVVQQYQDGVGAGLDAPAIAQKLQNYLDSLTDKQVDGMARGSTATVFNAGRHVSILELQPQLNPTAIRAEVGDENSCDPCATPAEDGGLNGLQLKIGSPEYFENMPPAGCRGKVRCRGFLIVEAKP